MTLVHTARWVISTPAGVRVDPEVYYKYAMSSVSRATSENAAPSVSGTASTAINRGRCWGGQGSHKPADRLGGSGGGQHCGGSSVCHHRRQTLGVPSQSRRKERDRDVAGVDCGEEGSHVVQTLWRNDRHPVTGRGDLLQAAPHRGRGCPASTAASGASYDLA